MKKLLGLLGAAGLVATTSATVVACGSPKTSELSVTLKTGELTKDITIKSDKITDGGTVTTKLDDKSVLTAVVKETKVGETTLTISTTEDKLTEKDIKESVKVLFKAKGAAAETQATEIATVSVTVKAKEKAQELKDLSKVTLPGFTATNDTTNQQVIDALKQVEGLSTISEANDVEIAKVNATQQAAGTITITAKESSKLVKGSLVLSISKLEATKIKLSEVTLSGFTATNDTTNQQVIDALKQVEGLSTISEANDVEIAKVNATQQAAGTITITAKESSKLVKGSLVLSISKLEATKMKLSEVTLSGFTATNDTTNQQVIDALKQVEGLSTISEANDVEIAKVPATQQAAGTITITAKGSSTLVEGALVLPIAQLTQ